MILNTLTPEEMQRMLGELQLRQSALELQNVELRQAQVRLDVARAHYFSLYDLAPVGYCILDEQGLILQANLAAAALLGVARAALVNQPITQCIIKADQDMYCLYRKQIIASGDAQSCELRMSKNDGKQFWVQLQTTIAQDADGAPELRTVLSDVTSEVRQRKQGETELASCRRITENAHQAKLHVLATISHDLRQPLAALCIYVSALNRHVAPGGQPLLANMKDCITSLSELLSKNNVSADS